MSSIPFKRLARVVLACLMPLVVTAPSHAAVALLDEFSGTALDGALWTEVDFDVSAGLVANDASIAAGVGGGTLTMTGSGPSTGFDKGQALLSNASLPFPTGGEVYTLTLFHGYFASSGFLLESVRKQAGVLSGLDDAAPQTVPGQLALSIDSSGAVTGTYGPTTMNLATSSPADFPTFRVIVPTVGRSSSDQPLGDYDRIELRSIRRCPE